LARKQKPPQAQARLRLLVERRLHGIEVGAEVGVEAEVEQSGHDLPFVA
jgi:hypothetical protein